MKAIMGSKFPREIMRQRVYKILVVSPEYDYNIMDEFGAGGLSDRFRLVDDLHPTDPLIDTVPHLRDRDPQATYDLVILIHPINTAHTVRKLAKLRATFPRAAVYAVCKQHAPPPAPFDTRAMFLWHGRADIFLTCVKLHEDRLNAAHDLVHGARALLILESDPHRIAEVVPMIYEQVFRIAEDQQSAVNAPHHQLRKRMRFKVLLATDLAQACELIAEHHAGIIGVVCTVRLDGPAPRVAAPFEELFREEIPQSMAHAAFLFLDPGPLPSPQTSPCASPLPLPLAFRAYADVPTPTAAPTTPMSTPKTAVLQEERPPADLAQLRAMALPARNLIVLRHRLPEFFEFLGRGAFRWWWMGVDATPLQPAASLAQIRAQLASKACLPGAVVRATVERNLLSAWAYCHGELGLFEALTPIAPAPLGPNAPLGAIEEENERLRAVLVDLIDEYRRVRAQGIILDFQRDLIHDDVFLKIGGGSTGGKARGLAFLESLLPEVGPMPYELVVPWTVVIGTAVWELFVTSLQKDEPITRCASVPSTNNLAAFAAQEDLGDDPFLVAGQRMEAQARARAQQLQTPAAMTEDERDAALREKYLAHSLPAEVVRDLEFLLREVPDALVVRPSTLLEDTKWHLFAISETHLLPPNPDTTQRLADLCSKIKLIYASLAGSRARKYLSNIGVNPSFEKMAVLIQRLSGYARDGLVFPAVSGVLRSHDVMVHGEATIALLFGMYDFTDRQFRAPFFTTKLDRPNCPMTREHALQTSFRALDLRLVDKHLHSNASPAQQGSSATAPPRFTTTCELKRPAERRLAQRVGSIYWSLRDNTQVSFMSNDPSQVVRQKITWSTLLRADPLLPTLRRLLEVVEKYLATPFELHFTLDFADPTDRKAEPRIEFLQFKELIVDSFPEPFLQVDIPRLWQTHPALRHPSRVALASLGRSQWNRDAQRGDVLGHGGLALQDLLYLRCEGDLRKSALRGWSAGIVEELDYLNKALARPYVAVAPGRWGNESGLEGIPVRFFNLSHCRALIETDFADERSEPSEGSHFLDRLREHNVLMMHIPREDLCWDRIRALPQTELSTENVVHVRLTDPIYVLVDATSQKGIFFLKEGAFSGSSSGNAASSSSASSSSSSSSSSQRAS